MLVLTVTSGPLAGRNLELTGQRPVVLGRYSLVAEDVDPKMSRRHAMLRRDDKGWILQDLGSRNGTWVNEQHAQKPVRLRDGDEIRCGRTVFAVAIFDEATAAAEPARPRPSRSAVAASVPFAEMLADGDVELETDAAPVEVDEDQSGIDLDWQDADDDAMVVEDSPAKPATARPVAPKPDPTPPPPAPTARHGDRREKPDRQPPRPQPRRKPEPVDRPAAEASTPPPKREADRSDALVHSVRDSIVADALWLGQDEVNEASPPAPANRAPAAATSQRGRRRRGRRSIRYAVLGGLLTIAAIGVIAWQVWPVGDAANPISGLASSKTPGAADSASSVPPRPNADSAPIPTPQPVEKLTTPDPKPTTKPVPTPQPETPAAPQPQPSTAIARTSPPASPRAQPDPVDRQPEQPLRDDDPASASGGDAVAMLDPFRSADSFATATTIVPRTPVTLNPPPGDAEPVAVTPTPTASGARAPEPDTASSSPSLPPPLPPLPRDLQTVSRPSDATPPAEPAIEPDAVAPPELPRPKPVRDPSIPAPLDEAERVVFLVDASGSMIDTMPLVIKELERVIAQLRPDQRFTIFFYQKNQVIEVEPAGMKEATRRNKTLVGRWMDPKQGHVFAVGPSYPLDAVKQALKYQPDQIFILADKVGTSVTSAQQSRQFLEELEQLNPQRLVQFNAVHLFYDDPVDALATLATRHGGTYRFVSIEDVVSQQPAADSDPLRESLMMLMEGGG